MRIVSLVYSPQHCRDKQNDVYYRACIERHVECIDKEQLKPSANGDDTWHNTIEYCCNDNNGYKQGYKGPLEVGIWKLLVIEYQDDSRNTKQVEKVNTDRQASHVGNENEPTVGTWFVCHVFPLQDKPEYYGCEARGIGIYFTFYG